MKRTKNGAPQGDVVFVRIDSLPDTAVPRKDAGVQPIMAHSETGHHHVAKPRRGYRVDVFDDEKNPDFSYLRIRRDETVSRAEKASDSIAAVLLEHQRSHHTHEAQEFGEEGEIWKFSRQRRRLNGVWTRVAD